MILYPLPQRTRISLTGKDRQTFLHGFCTNDIKKLTPGQGCEAFVTSIKGRTLGHVFIASTEDALLLDTVPGQLSVLMPHLDRYIITEDVTLTDITDATSTYFATGAPTGLELAPYAHSTVTIAETPVLIQRLDWLSQAGYLISIPQAKEQHVVDELTRNGFVLSTTEDFESARIAAGFPLFGKDISDANLPQEVDRTELAISFKKGCYLGQEPIARLDALGHVNKILRRVQIENAPKTGASSLEMADASSGQKAGILTSIGNRDGQTWGLGYINTKYADSGHLLSNAEHSVQGRVV